MFPLAAGLGVVIVVVLMVTMVFVLRNFNKGLKDKGSRLINVVSSS